MTELPEPLTPPECDCRGLPFMPLDTVRLMDSDLFALSTGDEFKAAVALWCKAWTQLPAGSIPDDDRVLAVLSGAGARWRKVRDMALRGWVKCSDGRLYHPVVCEKALGAWGHRQSQRARANRRWQSHGNATADAAGYATALPRDMPRQCKGEGEGQLREEIDASASIKAEGARDASPTRQATGTRLPADWELPEEWRSWAVSEFPDIDISRQAAQFRDYWHAAAGAKARKADWLATWRMWCRRSAETAETRHNMRDHHGRSGHAGSSYDTVVAAAAAVLGKR